MIVNALLLFFTIAVLTILGNSMTQRLPWAHRFFLGLMTVTVLASIWSLFGGITVAVRWGAMAVFVAVLWWQRAKLALSVAHISNKICQFSVLDWCFYVVSFGVVAYASAATIGLYDTGLYHTQNIKWIEAYPAIPGLGNLHGRFAFNSHVFLPNAVFNFRFDKAGETVLVYPINAAAVWVVLAQAYHKLKTSVQRNHRFLTTFYGVILVFVALLYPSWLNAPSPDILSALVVLQVLMMAVEKRSIDSIQTLFFSALVVWAITLKLSNALLIFAALPFFGQTKFLELKQFGMRIVLIAAIISGPFVARNAILSGYVVYPFSAIDVLDVDWKIPAATVEAEREHIASWAKVPRQAVEITEQQSISEWFPSWWQRKSMPFKVLLGLNGLSFISVFFAPKGQRKQLLMVSSAVAINLIFWFTNAPDPRFVHGFLIFNAALGLAIWASRLPVFSRLMAYPQLVTGMCIALVVAGGSTILTPHSRMINENMWLAAPYLKLNEIETKTTPFVHQIPVGNNRCFDAELPCMPEENVNVELREDNIVFGFKNKIE